MHSRQTKALLSSLIQRYIDEGRLTTEQLADAAGVSVSTAWRWKSGDSLPDAHELRSIAANTGIEIDIRLAVLGVVAADTTIRVESCESQPVAEMARTALRGVVQQAGIAQHVTEALADKWIDPNEAADGLALIAQAQATLDQTRQSFERHMRPGPRSAAI